MKKILLSLFILVFSLNSNAQLIEVNKAGVTESEYSLQQFCILDISFIQAYYNIPYK